MRQSIKLAAATAFVISVPAFAQVPTVDGTLDASYGAALAVQQVQTQFGDANPFNGSELNAAYAQIASGRLYIMLTGNIERNFNKLELFIDSKAGGENVISQNPQYDYNDNGNWISTNMRGLTFDAGFETDYHLFARSGGNFTDALEVDFVDRQGGVPNQVPGAAGKGSQYLASQISSGNIPAGALGPNASTSSLANQLDFALNNENIAGVTGGTEAADQAAALAVTTGFEFSIALSDIGYTGGAIRIAAMVNNSNHNYLSNQFLGALAAPQGNLGGNGTGGFDGTLSGVNLNNFAGSQFFTISPAITILKGDFGGNESSNGSFNTPDGSFNELDVEGFLLALNDQAAYLALNPSLSSSLVAMGDFGGNESTNGSFNTPDGAFNELDVEGFLLALNDPAGYAAIQPPGLGGVSAIPEPAALGVLAPMAMLVTRRRRGR